VSSTTVGYGDLFPTSAAGKAMGTVTMVVGILVLALPITIIGTNFVEEYAAGFKAFHGRVVRSRRRTRYPTSPTYPG
jgi:ABC-type phosphate transport system permease subunit